MVLTALAKLSGPGWRYFTLKMAHGSIRKNAALLGVPLEGGLPLNLRKANELAAQLEAEVAKLNAQPAPAPVTDLPAAVAALKAEPVAKAPAPKAPTPQAVPVAVKVVTTAPKQANAIPAAPVKPAQPAAPAAMSRQELNGIANAIGAANLPHTSTDAERFQALQAAAFQAHVRFAGMAPDAELAKSAKRAPEPKGFNAALRATRQASIDRAQKQKKG